MSHPDQMSIESKAIEKRQRVLVLSDDMKLNDSIIPVHIGSPSIVKLALEHVSHAEQMRAIDKDRLGEDELTYPPDEKFLIHESVLCSTSPYFKRALEKTWKEGMDGEVYLSNMDKEAFEIYSKWLYTGRVFLDSHGRTLPQNCYELGGYLLDTDFNDALIDRMYADTKETDMANVGFLYTDLYKISRKDSARRKWL